MVEQTPSETVDAADGESRDAWHHARRAAMAFRDMLIAAGLARDFPYLSADVNSFGNGIVNIGRTTPDAAFRLAQLANLGLDVLAQRAGNGGSPEQS